jgi:hypothetical protein
MLPVTPAKIAAAQIVQQQQSAGKIFGMDKKTAMLAAGALALLLLSGKKKLF